MAHWSGVVATILATLLPLGATLPPAYPSSQTALVSRPIGITRVQALGNVTATRASVSRDLGFQGKLGKHIFLTYGDTVWNAKDGSDESVGITSNSVGIACHDPTKVFDPLLNEDQMYPDFFLKPDSRFGEHHSEDALGVTNVIETKPGYGIVYFLLNHRPNGTNTLVGAGVAEVEIKMEPSGVKPRTTRSHKYLWDAEQEPWYGDVCSVMAEGYIYAYGHAKDNDYVYLARAPAEQVLELDAYEYWNGGGWQLERLRQENISEKEGVFWMTQQGQVVWSHYHGCFIFVYCDAFWSDRVLIRTAAAPQGPWSEPMTITTATLVSENGAVYSAVPHPYFDKSGKTLIVTFTNYPNTIQAIRVTFA